jgi:hypothetical protein
MMDGMSRLAKVVMLAGLLVAGAGAALLVVFLVGQGLDRAGLWATVLTFGLTAAGTVASIWAVVLARSPADVVDVPDGERAPDARGETAGPSPAPGSITQTSSSGTNIAHTGNGDINISGPPQ